ncbi:hypothetical protein BD779DRAFT_509490 [Infundibulicybe gibba]|nr:hypothetical protein BD779DRAFT_509490 [Infundibulicybe gibba]
MAEIRRAISNKKYLDPVVRLHDIFQFESLEDGNLHVVILPPNSARKKLNNPIPQSPALFQLLQLRVSALRSWLREDVENIGGHIIKPGDPRPPLLAVIEGQLALPRTYTVSSLLLHSKLPADSFRATTTTRYRGLGFRMAREMYATFFQKIFSECNSDNPFVSVKGDREFGAFFKVLECFQKDSNSISENESSALKASQLIVHFIVPPFFSGSCDAFTYKQQRPLSFPIFLSQSDQPEAWCKYTPTPYFMALSKFGSTPEFKFEFPLIISEVGSKEDESGRQRMLLQAIAFSRAGQYLMKPDKQFYMVAIYLRADMTAERYVVALAEKPENKVLICQEDFDLCSPSDAVLFLREMYNLATMLEELVDRFDPEKRTSLSDIEKYARELLSPTEMAERTRRLTQGTLRMRLAILLTRTTFRQSSRRWDTRIHLFYLATR